jgi:hypothetical protein
VGDAPRWDPAHAWHALKHSSQDSDSQRRLPLVATVLLVALVLAACGGGNGGARLSSALPDSVPGSLPGSLPTSVPSSTQTTESQPGTTESTTETTTATVTASPPPSTTGTNDTPWGWIAALILLLVVLVVTVGWALGRRGAARKNWSANARQASADGMAFHDAAMGEVIAAAMANRPERWSAIAGAGDHCETSLQRLASAAPDEHAGRLVRSAQDAAAAVGSAVAIALAAPPGRPLDDAAGRTLRERLAPFAAAIADLAAYAEQG